MKQRLYLIPIIFILSAIGYVVAYYPWLTNPRPEEDIAKDSIEAVARLPKQCLDFWSCIKPQKRPPDLRKSVLTPLHFKKSSLASGTYQR